MRAKRVIDQDGISVWQFAVHQSRLLCLGGAVI